MWNKNTSNIPNRDQLGVLIGVLLLGLAITQFVQLPSQQLDATVLGSALGISISGYWMIVSVLAVLASTGTDMLIRSHPRLSKSQAHTTLVAWILPGLTVLAAGRILMGLPNWPLWCAGLCATGIVSGAVATAEYALIGVSQPAGARARLFLNIVAYVLALVLYAAVYYTRARSLITATVTLGITFLIALDLLWVARAGLKRTALFAGIIGLILAECSWGLNYWQISLGTASLLLLLTFYTTSGLAAQYLMGKLTRHVLIEYGVVAAVGGGMLIAFHP